MENKMSNMAEKMAEQMNDMTIDLVEESIATYFKGFDDVVKSLGMGNFFMNRIFDGGLVPTINSLLEIEKDTTDSIIKTIYGEQKWQELFEDLYNRIYAGSRYEELVKTYGKDLFGSAKYKGEKLLKENNWLTLTYIPPKEGVEKQDAALFHVGGILPYSDKIFRFLPEVNFFDRFTERGIPVYAVELNGDKDNIKDYGGLNLEKYIDIVEEFSDIAFEHNKGKKLMLEGYCGLGMIAYAYPLAKPKEADRKFKLAFTNVAPIDGSKCRTLADVMTKMPQHLLLTQFSISSLMGGYVTGDSLRRTQDLALKGFFPKTYFGRFFTGWKNSEYAKVKKIEDLSPDQRKDLAGAYWISPQNCNRYPVPVDLARYSSRLFRNGITDEGDLPYDYKGKQLSFQNLLKNTSMKFAGFYGGKDKLVPEETAHVLKKVLKDRYSHVVHTDAGHIAYVLTPSAWDVKHTRALKPNPIDVLLDLYKK